MSRVSAGSLCAVAILALALPPAWEDPTAPDPSQDDEQAIHDVARSWLDRYNRGDEEIPGPNERNMFDAATELPRLLPKVIAWAEAQAAETLARGVPLTDSELRLARAVGVRRPERIRVAEVRVLPAPGDPELRRAGLETGLIGPQMAGSTLGYAIHVLEGYRSNRLLAHECRHVQQYEAAGSIAAFLPEYLRQIVEHGYESAPLEVDARAHEQAEA